MSDDREVGEREREREIGVPSGPQSRTGSEEVQAAERVGVEAERARLGVEALPARLGVRRAKESEGVPTRPPPLPLELHLPIPPPTHRPPGRQRHRFLICKLFSV